MFIPNLEYERPREYSEALVEEYEVRKAHHSRMKKIGWYAAGASAAAFAVGVGATGVAAVVDVIDFKPIAERKEQIEALRYGLAGLVTAAISVVTAADYERREDIVRESLNHLGKIQEGITAGELPPNATVYERVY